MIRTLIVEDEFLVRMMLEDFLQSLGCNVVAAASTLSEALRLAQTAEIDLAVLDVNLNGSYIYPAAALLKSRNVPIVFATGYGREGLADEWQVYPVLQKPYGETQLQTAISQAGVTITSA
jgi:CheY-like chemotaxis protein